MRVATLPLASIRRPLQRVLNEAKVAWLMESIAAVGQQEPIGLAMLTALVRRATPDVLRLHML